MKIGTFSLNKYKTIFDAKAIAIMKAIEYLINIQTTRDCNIFTDSSSVLRTLNNPVNLNETIDTIKKSN